MTARRPARVEDEGEIFMSVYSGRVLLGHILEHEGRCTARTWPAEVDLGEFRNRREAADAVSAAAASATRPAKRRPA
jgi:hypothetical protein